MLTLLKAIPLKVWGIGVIVALVAAGLVTLSLKMKALERERDEARALAVQEGLSKDSIQAVQDSTRKIFGDSVVSIWERRVLQLEDSVTKLESDVAIQVDTVYTITTAAVVDTGGVREADFTVREPPYTAQISVKLPPPPALGEVKTRISLDPLELGLDITCGAPDPLVRPAIVTAEGPAWAQVTFRSIRQDPAVCGNRPQDLFPVQPKKTGAFWHYAGGIVIGATAALIAAEEPKWTDALVGAGLGGTISFVTWHF